jgi:hypothetical protein
MQRTEQSSTEQEIMVAGNAMDPAERERRLGQVYAFLLDLARQKRAAAQDAPNDQSQPLD